MCLSDLENHRPKVDIKREKNQKSLVKDPKFETTLIQQNRSDRSPCDLCKEKKRQGNTSFGEKGVIAISSLFTKDVLEKQKSWSLGGKMQIESENKSTLCKIHAKSPKGNGIGIQNEEKQPSETSTRYLMRNSGMMSMCTWAWPAVLVPDNQKSWMLKVRMT